MSRWTEKMMEMTHQCTLHVLVVAMRFLCTVTILSSVMVPGAHSLPRSSDGSSLIALSPDPGILRVDLEERVVVRCCRRVSPDLLSVTGTTLHLWETTRPGMRVSSQRELATNTEEANCIIYDIKKVELHHIDKFLLCQLRQDNKTLEEQRILFELEESSITLSMQPSPGSLTADLGERIKISCSLEPLTYSYSLSLTKQNVPDDWIFLLEILPVDRKMNQDKLTIEHEIEKVDSTHLNKEYVCEAIRDGLSIRKQVLTIVPKKILIGRDMQMRKKIIEERTFTLLLDSFPKKDSVIHTRRVQVNLDEHVTVQCCVKPSGSDAFLRVIFKTSPFLIKEAMVSKTDPTDTLCINYTLTVKHESLGKLVTCELTSNLGDIIKRGNILLDNTEI